MSYEIPTGPISLAGSTGLRQYRFVTLPSTGSKAGKVAYPNASTIGQPVIGVLVTEGTTASTTASQTCGVQIMGVVQVEAEASTLSAGNWCSASTVGRAQTTTNTGDSRVGIIVDGSSGGANRKLSVLLIPFGSTSINPV